MSIAGGCYYMHRENVKMRKQFEEDRKKRNEEYDAIQRKSNPTLGQ